jgi:hypothetical protein
MNDAHSYAAACLRTEPLTHEVLARSHEAYGEEVTAKLRSMIKEMEPKRKITFEDAKLLISRNLSPYPTTFGVCSLCYKHRAQGSSPCVHCAQEVLAAYVGKVLAEEFVRATREVGVVVRRMDYEMEGKL